MTTYNVPTRDDVSADNQVIFDAIKGKLGTMPSPVPVQLSAGGVNLS